MTAAPSPDDIKAMKFENALAEPEKIVPNLSRAGSSTSLAAIDSGAAGGIYWRAPERVAFTLGMHRSIDQ